MANEDEGEPPTPLGASAAGQAWLRQLVSEALHGSWALFARFVILVILAAALIYLLKR